MKVLLVIIAISLSYPVLSLEYQVEQNSQINETAAIDIKLQQQLFEDNFTFSNHFILHNSEKFNLSVTANISQITAFEQQLTSENKLMPTIYLPVNEASHQYGLIGSYSLSSKWQVSGGLIYSKPSVIISNEQSNTDNVALIGTSYSF